MLRTPGRNDPSWTSIASSSAGDFFFHSHLDYVLHYFLKLRCYYFLKWFLVKRFCRPEDVIWVGICIFGSSNTIQYLSSILSLYVGTLNFYSLPLTIPFVDQLNHPKDIFMIKINAVYIVRVFSITRVIRAIIQWLVGQGWDIIIIFFFPISWGNSSLMHFFTLNVSLDC